MNCKDCHEVLLLDRRGYYFLSRKGGHLYYCGKTGEKHIPEGAKK